MLESLSLLNLQKLIQNSKKWSIISTGVWNNIKDVLNTNDYIYEQGKAYPINSIESLINELSILGKTKNIDIMCTGSLMLVAGFLKYL